MSAFIASTAARAALGRPTRPQLPAAAPRPRHRTPRCSQSVSTSMKLNKLGSSDLMVTEICLGTMTWGVQNTEQEAIQQMDYAIKERGVNFMDTAEMYPIPGNAPGWIAGETERYIGRYLKNNPTLRDDLILATKVIGRAKNSAVAAARNPSISYNPGSFPDACLDRKNILEACDASLSRLNTDYIDLYQLHWPDRYAPIFGEKEYNPSLERDHVSFRETLTGIKQLLDAGKIRTYGLSNETTYGVAEFVKAADELGMPRPVSIQNNFALLNRSFESELCEACTKSNYDIALLPYSVLAGGALSGKYLGKLNKDGDTSDQALRKSRFVLYKFFQKRFSTEKAIAAVKKYGDIARRSGITPSQLALAFCKTRFFIPSTIIGATSMEQLVENMDAFDIQLDEEVLAEIDEVHFSNRDPATFP